MCVDAFKCGPESVGSFYQSVTLGDDVILYSPRKTDTAGAFPVSSQPHLPAAARRTVNHN